MRKFKCMQQNINFFLFFYINNKWKHTHHLHASRLQTFNTYKVALRRETFEDDWCSTSWLWSFRLLRLIAVRRRTSDETSFIVRLMNNLFRMMSEFDNVLPLAPLGLLHSIVRSFLWRLIRNLVRSAGFKCSNSIHERSRQVAMFSVKQKEQILMKRDIDMKHTRYIYVFKCSMRRRLKNLSTCYLSLQAKLSTFQYKHCINVPCCSFQIT